MNIKVTNTVNIDKTQFTCEETKALPMDSQPLLTSLPYILSAKSFKPKRRKSSNINKIKSEHIARITEMKKPTFCEPVHFFYL